MALSTGSKKGALQAAINVTPLVDVVLVLLIIFMVVTPMLSRGKQVELPSCLLVESGQPQQSALVLSVTADKKLWLDNRALGLAELGAQLERALSGKGDRALLMKADAALSLTDLRPILLTLKTAKLRQLAFAVAEPPRSGP